MAFVFYDVETTGTNVRHDQIVQFAAIRTDVDLVETERVEFRCRVDRHLVPHPEALLLTGRTLADVTDPSLPSHYEMMRKVAQLIEEWSPATLIGFNSVRFDEEMLRHGLYRTLHNPYLTSWNGNARADALTLCRSVAFFSPGALIVPEDDAGKRRFTLELLGRANGLDVSGAHSAMVDAEVTLALCRLVMTRDEECWSRFLQFSAKRSAAALVDCGQAFGTVRFRGNDPRPTVAVSLGTGHLDPNQRVCLDLAADLDWLGSLPEQDLASLVTSVGTPVFKLRVNGCPSLCEIWDLPPECRPGLDDEECDARARRVLTDPRIGARLMSMAQASAASRTPSEHVEEQLYDELPDRADDDLQRRFHAAEWHERLTITRNFGDRRLRRLGQRMIYLEAPHVLDPAARERLDATVVDRRGSPAGSRPWTTLADARKAVHAMQASGFADARDLVE